MSKELIGLWRSYPISTIPISESRHRGTLLPYSFTFPDNRVRESTKTNHNSTNQQSDKHRKHPYKRIEYKLHSVMRPLQSASTRYCLLIGCYQLVLSGLLWFTIASWPYKKVLRSRFPTFIYIAFLDIYSI